MRKVVKGVALTLGVVVALPIAFVAINVALMWDDSEVSHWKSNEARARFEGVYADTMALLPEPALTQDVQTDLGTVRAYRFDRPGADAAYRDRAPIVLLPGHSAPTPMWQGTIETLFEDRPVISIDLLGQPGLSVPTAKVVDAEDQARWLEQTLAGLGVDQVHVVGLSFGGWLAMNHATHHPGRVASLTLLDPAQVFTELPVDLMVAAMLTEFPLVPASYDKWFMAWTAGGVSVDPSVPEARIIAAGMEEYKVLQPSPAQVPEEAIRELDVPVQVFLGGRSVVHTSIEDAEQNAEQWLRDGRVVVKPDGSHAIHGEYFDEVNADIRHHAVMHDG